MTKRRIRTPLLPIVKQFIRQCLWRVPGARTWVHQSPPYYVGSVLENRLGWQLVRLRCSPQSSYPDEVIPSSHRAYFEELRETGATVIPDALPADDRKTVTAEAAQIEQGMHFQGLRNNDMVGYLEQATHSIQDAGSHPILWRLLAQNALIQALATFVMGVTVGPAKRIDLDYYRSIDQPQEQSNDVDNVLHSDLHLDTIKVFYTLSEVTLENGPFVYARGTHRHTRARKRHEYRKSIDSALLKAGRLSEIPPERLATVGNLNRIQLTPAEHTELEVEETPLTAPPGALIVANTFGFHRRGEFQPGQLRRWIQVGFRGYNRGIS